jgi:sulfofructosephosphate aldolase
VNLDVLARDSGTFLMVAMDQRDSLRTMLAQHHPAPIDDERIIRFKLAVARELGPYASGFLIDRHYGFADVLAQQMLPASCGLLLAADALEQPPGGVVEDTDLDEGVDPVRALAGCGPRRLPGGRLGRLPGRRRRDARGPGPLDVGPRRRRPDGVAT